MPEVFTPEVEAQIAEPMLDRSALGQVRTPWHVWLAVAVAFALRYGWVVLAHKYRFTLANHYDFGEEMGAVARSLVTGHGFSSPFPEWSGPTTWVAPGYPLLIAAVFKIFGLYSTASALVMLALNSAFSALTCVPIYLLGRELTTRRVSLYSTWLWALVPQFMVWAIDWIWDAALTGLVLTAFVLIAIRMGRSATRKQWIAFGIAWGLAALLNPTLLSVLPFMLCYIAWNAHRRREPWIGRFALCCLLFALVVTPWLARNYRAFGRFVFIRGNFWAEMRFGNSIWGDGLEMKITHPEVNQFERNQYLTLGEQGYFAWKKHDTLEFVHEYPKFFAELCLRRVLLFWWDFGDYYGILDDTLLTMGRRIFSTLALVGMIWLFVKRRQGAFVVASVLCVFPAVFYLTYPPERYRHVLEPLLVICAVFAVSQVREFQKLFPAD